MTQTKAYNKYIKLRREFPLFVYESYEITSNDKGLGVTYTFRVGKDVVFKPQIFFQGESFASHTLTDPYLHSMAFHIGLVEMISYWKAFCCPEILVKPFSLDAAQQAWWKKLFIYGLGEFFYTNGIPMPGNDLFSTTFDAKASELPILQTDLPTKAGMLIPVGGGKDSVVGIDILNRYTNGNMALVMNPRAATQRVIELAGFDRQHSVIVDRKIDPLLLDLNERGFLNGHTPFSALLAFVSLLAAYVRDIRNIALSNESSASEPTIPGTNINHQYSKSLSFEQDFRMYVNKYIHKNIHYFSVLRPLNELQIGGLFARLKQYHAAFRSCNAGSKTDSWCCNCPKCLFTCIILSPFLQKEAIKHIYGMDLLEREDLSPDFDQLTGQAANKPFECVGTIDEVNAALVHLLKQYENHNQTLPALLEHYKQTNAYQQNKHININTFLTSITDEGFLDTDLKALINNIIKNTQW